MIDNTIIAANKEQRKALVFSLTFPSLHLVEMASHVGFEAVNIDGEHGYFSSESIDDICRVANGYGMSVTARVPDSSAYWINLFLDRGVQGITGPHINTGEEAQSLADACLFPPAGKRSWGGGRGTEFNDSVIIENKFGGKLGFAKWSNANMQIWAQIESKTAWENLDDILKVEGLTGITGGPHDLAASIGYPGQPDHEERVKITEDANSRARIAGKQVSSDVSTGTGISELMLVTARDLVKKNKTLD